MLFIVLLVLLFMLVFAYIYKKRGGGGGGGGRGGGVVISYFHTNQIFSVLSFSGFLVCARVYFLFIHAIISVLFVFQSAN